MGTMVKGYQHTLAVLSYLGANMLGPAGPVLGRFLCKHQMCGVVT